MRLFTLTMALLLLLGTGCAGQGGGGAPAAEPEEAPLLEVEAPAPVEVPEPVEVSSDEDWAARAHNKEIEVLQVVNIINPVAAYITKGFELHGESFSETLHEEWTDTQAQLGQAMTLYDDCKKRKAAGSVDKQLFLDLEEVWQLLVKTGVAGVRTKSMVDQELKRLKA